MDIEEIKTRSIKGTFALTLRTFILQAVAFVSTFILTILLSPSVFGIFFVVSALINFLSYFSDIGLAAALIQKKDEPSREDLITTFTIQQILVLFLVFLGLFFSSKIVSFYEFSIDGLWLLRALIFSFFLSSLKTIPSVILERKLDFNRLVIPQIVETIVFYITAIILAILRLGILSFAWAALLRGFSGLVTIYILSPWRIAIGIKKSSLKELLSFGLPFQTNSILALIKDDLMTVFLGKILPVSAIGYLGWAKKWAEAPLRLFMDSIMRVTFPAYSRLQKEKQSLKKAIEKSLFFLSLAIFPVTIGMIILMRPLIFAIPRYSKWEPALIPFYLYSLSIVFACFSTPIVNALNAIGKIKKTLYLMVFWTVLTWVLYPVFAIKFGYQGIAFAALIVSSTSFLPIILLKKEIDFSVVKNILLSLFFTVMMGFLVVAVLKTFGTGTLSIIFSAIGGFLFYLILILLFVRQEILAVIKKIFH